MTRLLAIGTLLALAPRAALAMGLTVTGSWSTDIDVQDLLGGAGTELVSQKTSATHAVEIDLHGALDPSDPWRVDVRRSDTHWSPDLRVWVRRVDDGTGTGTISGGTAWEEVTAGDVPFFAGSGNRTAVGLQVRITDLSLQVPPDHLATTLVYTVVDP